MNTTVKLVMLALLAANCGRTYALNYEVFASAFAFIFHVFSPSSRAAHHLGHPQVKIYTLYTFYTATKRGFAITSVEWSI